MLFKTIDSQGSHEQVIFCRDNESGLKAIIAIHNTNLGPALGGLRVWDYASEEEALNDVLRLSYGMTYKAACAGLNLGGGKSIIIGDAAKLDKKKILKAFGKFVNSLGGKYITAKDVGITTEDVTYLKEHCNYVAEAPDMTPSIYTAFGTFQGLKAAVNKTWKDRPLSDITIAVQGAGEVGTFLIDYLCKDGVKKVFVTDLNQEVVTKLVEKYPNQVEAVPTDKILSQDCDVFAPCALGGIIKAEDISNYKFKVIAGGANNQLETEDTAEMLAKSNITYVPDYILNAGGLIAVSQTNLNLEETMSKVEGIYNQITELLDLAESKNIDTETAARQMAEARIYNKNKKPATSGEQGTDSSFKSFS